MQPHEARGSAQFVWLRADAPGDGDRFPEIATRQSFVAPLQMQLALPQHTEKWVCISPTAEKACSIVASASSN